MRTDIGMALAGLKSGLRMLYSRQYGSPVFNRVAGYHDYEGITEDFGERKQINNASLGKNRALGSHAQSRPAYGRQNDTVRPSC